MVTGPVTFTVPELLNRTPPVEPPLRVKPPVAWLVIDPVRIPADAMVPKLLVVPLTEPVEATFTVAPDAFSSAPSSAPSIATVPASLSSVGVVNVVPAAMTTAVADVDVLVTVPVTVVSPVTFTVPVPELPSVEPSEPPESVKAPALVTALVIVPSVVKVAPLSLVINVATTVEVASTLRPIAAVLLLVMVSPAAFNVDPPLTTIAPAVPWVTMVPVPPTETSTAPTPVTFSCPSMTMLSAPVLSVFADRVPAPAKVTLPPAKMLIALASVSVPPAATAVAIAIFIVLPVPASVELTPIDAVPELRLIVAAVNVSPSLTVNTPELFCVNESALV